MGEIRVGVLGAVAGWARRSSARSSDAADMRWSCAVDSTLFDPEPGDRGDEMSDLPGKGAQVVVDFTHPDVVMDNIRFCVEHGIHCVVGTSGFDQAKLDTVRQWLASKPDVGVLIAPNFALGAVLSMHFAELAARFYPSAEIIELHHAGKARRPVGHRRPYGTADRGVPQGRRPGQAPGRHRTGPRPRPRRNGRRRPRALGPGPGLVAHQEVLFGGVGETLTIRHDSMDRTSRSCQAC